MLYVLSTKASCINVNICGDFPAFQCLLLGFGWFSMAADDADADDGDGGLLLSFNLSLSLPLSLSLCL